MQAPIPPCHQFTRTPKLKPSLIQDNLQSNKNPVARELAPAGSRSAPKKGLLRSPTGASPPATDTTLRLSEQHYSPQGACSAGDYLRS
ncbi:hypothetical protein C1X36_09730 [Pseudomonas sp. GW460-8]|nr:hypothetical protein C1X36_09730 [Pseudomonas sp. GW460-8]